MPLSAEAGDRTRMGFPPRDFKSLASANFATSAKQKGTPWRPLLTIESGKRDSNPRPQPWQGCALPTELFPRALNVMAQRSRPPSRPNLRTSSTFPILLDGGEGDRTPDLVNAIHALSQLSYAPVILGPAKR